MYIVYNFLILYCVLLFPQALCEEFEEECCVALAQTLERHLAEAEQVRRSSSN